MEEIIGFIFFKYIYITNFNKNIIRIYYVKETFIQFDHHSFSDIL